MRRHLHDAGRHRRQLVSLVSCLCPNTSSSTIPILSFCPALGAIAQRLGLSENLAGVTLLAFGNGAPDLFTAFAHHDGDTELMYAELLGAAAFIIGCVSAVIVMLRPFDVCAANLVRDTVFFMAACVWIGVAFRNESFTYAEANGTIGIYVLYLGVVFADHFRGRAAAARRERGSVGRSMNAAYCNTPLAGVSVLAQYNTADSLADQLRTLDQRHEFHKRPPEPPVRGESLSIGATTGANGLWAQFCADINPIDAGDWQRGRRLKRTLCLIRAPIRLALTLTVPCVDDERARHGWSKLLNTGHVLVLPVAALLMKQRAYYYYYYYCCVCGEQRFFVRSPVYHIQVGGVTIFAVVVPVAVFLAVVVFASSSPDEAPAYHMVSGHD